MPIRHRLLENTWSFFVGLSWVIRNYVRMSLPNRDINAYWTNNNERR